MPKPVLIYRNAGQILFCLRPIHILEFCHGQPITKLAICVVMMGKIGISIKRLDAHQTI